MKVAIKPILVLAVVAGRWVREGVSDRLLSSKCAKTAWRQMAYCLAKMPDLARA